MSLITPEVVLGTRGYGTEGFTFSVLGELLPDGSDYYARSQGDNPIFTGDFSGSPFVSFVEYKFEIYHPDYAEPAVLVRYTFDADGKALPSSAGEDPDNTLGGGIQKTLLQLAKESNLAKEMVAVKTEIGLKLRELAEFIADQTMTFINGAKVVIKRPFSQQVGITFESQVTNGGDFTEELFVGTSPGGVTRWIDRHGQFRTEFDIGGSRIVFSYDQAFYEGILRASQIYIINQDELLATDYLTTSNPVGALGSFKQNRISVENFRNQLRANLRLRDLSEFITLQSITFDNGAQPVIRVPFGTQGGLNFEAQPTAEGNFSFAMFLGIDTSGRMFLRDKYGNQIRLEPGTVVVDTNRLLLSGLLRAAQVGITSQNEVLTATYLTTSDAVPSQGSYFQNRISFDNLFTQFLALPDVEFKGHVTVRTSGRTVLPLITKPPEYVQVPELDPATGKYKDRFASLTQLADALIPVLIPRLPTDTVGGVSGNEVEFLGCIDIELPPATTQDFIISPFMIGTPQAHNLQLGGANIWPTLLGSDNRDASPYMSISFPDANSFLITADSDDTTDFSGKLNLRAISAT